MLGEHRHAWARVRCGDDRAKEVLHGVIKIVQQYHIVAEEPAGNISVRAPAYNVSLRVLVAESVAPALSYVVATGLHELLRPIFQRFAPLGEIHLESDVLYHARLSSLPPAFDEDAKQHFYTSRDLQGLHTANNRSSSHSLGDGARTSALIFELYLPASRERPLVLRDEETGVSATSFSVPGWGGIAVIEDLELDTLRLALGAFITCLRRVFRVPVLQPFVLSLSSPDFGLALWEIDALVRGQLRLHLVATVVSRIACFYAYQPKSASIDGWTMARMIVELSFK